MQPKDKFGNPIYPYIYKKLLDIGNRLEMLGFMESVKKPNLFYLHFSNDATVFADMRGTPEVKIWEEPIPLFYLKLKEGLPLWEQNRIKNTILKFFKENQIPFRESFYDEMDGWIEPYYYLLDTYREITGKSDKISEGIFYKYVSEDYDDRIGEKIRRERK